MAPHSFVWTLAPAVPFVVLICALAVGGGVGGGALYMPLYVWFTKDAHIAVPFSKVTTNGVAWSAFFYNIFARHPEKEKPLIDYDVALMLEPLTLIGTIIGVTANVLMTSGEVLIALVSITSLTALKTFEKGWEKKKQEDMVLGLYQRESNESTSARAAAPRTRDDNGALAGEIEMGSAGAAEKLDHASTSPDEEDVPLVSTSRFSDGDNFEEAEAKFLLYEARQYPWEKIALMLLCMVVHAGTLFYVGGQKGICGDYVQQGLLAGNVAFQMVFTLIWRQRCLARQKRRERLGLGGKGFAFDRVTTICYPFGSFLAGICAGALGIAGGLIKGPLMLNWGLLPQASTATAIFMIMFTSSSTILQFILLGRLELYTSLMFWFAGFLGGLLGSTAVAMLLKKLNRQSYVSLFLALIIVLSGVCMCGVVIAEIEGFVPAAESNIALNDFCSSRNTAIE